MTPSDRGLLGRGEVDGVFEDDVGGSGDLLELEPGGIREAGFYALAVGEAFGGEYAHVDFVRRLKGWHAVVLLRWSVVLVREGARVGIGGTDHVVVRDSQVLGLVGYPVLNVLGGLCIQHHGFVVSPSPVLGHGADVLGAFWSVRWRIFKSLAVNTRIFQPVYHALDPVSHMNPVGCTRRVGLISFAEGSAEEDSTKYAPFVRCRISGFECLLNKGERDGETACASRPEI